MPAATSTRSIVATLLSLALIAGCNPNGPDPNREPGSPSDPAPTNSTPQHAAAVSGYTAFAIAEEVVGLGTAEARHGFTIQLVGQRCTVWADVGPWKFDELSPKTASASCPSREGQKLHWKCSTPDERVFSSIEICEREYLLSQGRLFLISTQSTTPQVIQIPVTDAEGAELEVLATRFPEVAQFLSRQRLAPTAKESPNP